MESLSLERTLTQIDHVRLSRLMARASGPGAAHPPALEALEELLDSSELVEPAAVAADMVTMNSQVLLSDSEAAEPYPITLCYPDDAEPSSGKVSVLSPVGTGVLGLRVGNTARWHCPRGSDRSATVMAILFQPEAGGDYTL